MTFVHCTVVHFAVDERSTSNESVSVVDWLIKAGFTHYADVYVVGSVDLSVHVVVVAN